jgi:hypothetical protein
LLFALEKSTELNVTGIPLELLFIAPVFLGGYLTLKERGPARTKVIYIYLAAVWVIIFGLVPYAIAHYGPSMRTYSASLFGLAPLLALIFHLLEGRWKYLALLLLFGYISIGVAEFSLSSVSLKERELPENNFYMAMAETFPSIRSGTTLIFVDHYLSNNGCGPSFSMLYGKPDIHCAFLSSTDFDYRATRLHDRLNANRGGNLRDENWLLIGVNEQGTPFLIPEIGPGDYNLLINWISDEPVVSDLRRIESPQAMSEFYRYLLRRTAEMNR